LKYCYITVCVLLAAGASGANFGGWPANQQLEHNRLQAKGMQFSPMCLLHFCVVLKYLVL